MNRKMRRAETRNNGKQHRSARRNESGHRPAPIAGALTRRFAEALHCHQSGRLTKAIAFYDQILSLNPHLAAAHCNRGAALVGLGRFADAEAAYRRAIALNPRFVDAYNNLGIA
ncbi:MAG: tetratricopeptide repeat protein, partial [Xanthobacteraceae bacterium]